MSEQLDLDAIEARERAAIIPDEEPAMADMNEEILALIAELRKLREENASLQAMREEIGRCLDEIRAMSLEAARDDLKDASE